MSIGVPNTAGECPNEGASRPGDCSVRVSSRSGTRPFALFGALSVTPGDPPQRRQGVLCAVDSYGEVQRFFVRTPLLVIAEVEPVGGTPGHELMDGVAEVTAELAGPVTAQLTRNPPASRPSTPVTGKRVLPFHQW